MTCQIPSDCLDEIFEYLYLEDKFTLHSCLLVNCLWCESSVRILWKDVYKFTVPMPHKSKILNTLIACLPDESKDLLHKNEIFVSTQTWKPPLFNYASFCKVLSICEMDQMVQHVLENQSPNTSKSLNYKKYSISQEIFKMFMKEISSLKELKYTTIDSVGSIKRISNITFAYFPGAMDCLTDLSALTYDSNVYSEFFYQLS